MFKRKKILIAGDLMVDLYTMGEVQRISPEAPVPVVRVIEEIRRPGGAGNAALNLLSLGMDVSIFGRVGKDEGGSQFLHAMQQELINTDGIFVDPSFQTPLKNRMIAAGQQLLRVDYETPAPLSAFMEKEAIEKLPALLEEVSVVAISDYAKGFLTPSLLAALIKEAKLRHIPVIVDPKGIDFSRYRGATVLKPNLSEAITASGLSLETPIDEVAEHLLERLIVDSLMITRSQHGISLFCRKEGRRDFPAHVHEVKDVTGAGDTVLAVIAASMANAISLDEAAKLANVAAGLAIEHVGCARISLAELTARLVEKES